MVGPTGQLGRSDRLRRSSDFGRVGREGRRAAGLEFVLLIAPGPRGHEDSRQRLGITVSRKVGSAVVRNRVKRRVREWFRAARCELRPGIDLVVIGRSGAAGLTGQQVKGILWGLAQDVGATRASDPRFLALLRGNWQRGWCELISSPCPPGWLLPVDSSRRAPGMPSPRSSATVSCAV